jgi:hypothetical protein
MRLRKILNVTVTSSVLVLWACGAEHVTPIEGSDTNLRLISDTPVVAGDPFGACDAELFECSVRGAGCGGWSDPRACNSSGCEPERHHIACHHFCGTSADCPVPLTGDSQPVCEQQFCQLPCDTATCPNGYQCVEPVGGSVGYYLPKVCMQTFEGDVPNPPAAGE